MRRSAPAHLTVVDGHCETIRSSTSKIGWRLIRLGIAPVLAIALAVSLVVNVSDVLMRTLLITGFTYGLGLVMYGVAPYVLKSHQ